jgi:hypothetical protein
MVSKGSSVNRLSRKQQRALEDLCVTYKEDIESGKFTRACFAELASKRLGRPVLVTNVKSSAEFMNVNFRRGYAGGGYGNSLHELRSSIQLLAAELYQFKKEMGMVVSPTLEELARELATETIVVDHNDEAE